MANVGSQSSMMASYARKLTICMSSALRVERNVFLIPLLLLSFLFGCSNERSSNASVNNKHGYRCDELYLGSSYQEREKRCAELRLWCSKNGLTPFDSACKEYFDYPSIRLWCESNNFTPFSGACSPFYNSYQISDWCSRNSSPWCHRSSEPSPDIDCDDINGQIWVGSLDPYDLDRDDDGFGCE